MKSNIIDPFLRVAQSCRWRLAGKAAAQISLYKRRVRTKYFWTHPRRMTGILGDEPKPKWPAPPCWVRTETAPHPPASEGGTPAIDFRRSAATAVFQIEVYASWRAQRAEAGADNARCSSSRSTRGNVLCHQTDKAARKRFKTVLKKINCLPDWRNQEKAANSTSSPSTS